MQTTQNITFHHRQEMILPFLQEVVRFMDANLPAPNPTLAFKARVIVTELLTNSIKHAANGQTDISLTISPSNFTIAKTDSGAPFSAGTAPIQWPSNLPVNSVIKIYADKLNGLFARQTSPTGLLFFTEDYDDDSDLIADMSEHYGLMIICRACDIFTYQFNPQNCLNTFTAHIDL